TVVVLDDGSCVLRGIMVDVTTRKEKESELQSAEERYRSLVENLNDIVFSTNTDGILTYISPQITRLSTYTLEELTGRPFVEFIHADDRGVVMEGLPAVFGGTPDPREFRVVDKSGYALWVRASSRPRFEDGQLVGLTGILTDVTGRKRAEEQLGKSEQRFRHFVENLHDVVYALD